MNALEIVLLVLGILLVLGVMYVFFVCEITYRLSLRRGCPIAKIITKHMLKNEDVYKIDMSWWDKQKIEKSEIKSKDGLKLVGHFIEKPTNKIALIVHGFGSRAIEMQ